MDFQKRGLKSTIDFCFKYDQKKNSGRRQKIGLELFSAWAAQSRARARFKRADEEKKLERPWQSSGFPGLGKKNAEFENVEKKMPTFTQN